MSEIIIKSGDDLRKPLIAFCAMMRYCKEAGEDFLDYNSNLLNPWPFATWMYGRGYITEKQIDAISRETIEDQFFDVQSLLHSEILFPESFGETYVAENKAYAVLAEYISGFSEFRSKLYTALQGENAFNGGFYKDDDEIALSCKISEDDTKPNADSIYCNYYDLYMYVSRMSIEDADQNKLEKALSMAKNLEMTIDNAQFVVPCTVEEIIIEGKIMKNSLTLAGMYRERVERYPEGGMMLVFMKKNGESYMDIAISGADCGFGNIVYHAVLRDNEEITDEDYELLKKWIDEKGLSITKTKNELQNEVIY